MKKLIALGCVVSLSACSASGMTMGLGAGVTVAGGAILLSKEEDPGCDPLERATTGCYRRASVEAGNAVTTVAGLALVTFGVVLMGLGTWGVAEKEPAPREPGLALVPAETAAEAATAPAASPAARGAAPGQTVPRPSAAAGSNARASHDETQRQKLAAHIQLAAHANRCDAAVYLLGRLRDLDEARALSLARTDGEVARCAVAKVPSLGS